MARNSCKNDSNVSSADDKATKLTAHRKCNDDIERHLMCLVERISIAPETFKEISIVVNLMIRFLVDKLNDQKPSLRASEIVPTGSCYDRTKILAADEFDFLVVVDLGTTVEISLASDDGFAHIEAKPESDSTMKTSSFRRMFRSVFHAIVDMFIGTRFDAQNGFLTLKGYSVPINGPQCNIRTCWYNNTGLEIEIFIDVTPAIKYHNVLDVVSQDCKLNECILKTLLESNHVFLIPRPLPHRDRCFKLVFDEADKTLSSQLPLNHRKCLMLLKYFSTLIQRRDFRFKQIFNSFAMKMAIFQHSLCCKETQFISGCLQETIRFLIQCVRRDPPFLPSVFVPRRNIWSNSAAKSSFDITDRNIADDILKTILDILKSRHDSVERFIEDVESACRHVRSVDMMRSNSTCNSK